jgi:hypothetical protein
MENKVNKTQPLFEAIGERNDKTNKLSILAFCNVMRDYTGSKFQRKQMP